MILTAFMLLFKKKRKQGKVLAHNNDTKQSIDKELWELSILIYLILGTICMLYAEILEINAVKKNYSDQIISFRK